MAEMTRRTFFGKAIAGIAGFIGLALSVPILGYTILPSFRKREESWSEVGPVGKLETHQPKEYEIVHSLSSGWMKTSSTRSVWAFRKPEGEIVVYSPICTHLGCGYRWDVSKREFICPCHNSHFDLDGKVLSGPAPRPLDRLPTKQEEGTLFVLYKEFKAGMAKKEEI